jgi:hypothetical protein
LTFVDLAIWTDTYFNREGMLFGFGKQNTIYGCDGKEIVKATLPPCWFCDHW